MVAVAILLVVLAVGGLAVFYRCKLRRGEKEAKGETGAEEEPLSGMEIEK